MLKYCFKIFLGTKRIIEQFLSVNFQYIEKRYSDLWQKILRELFDQDLFAVIGEFALTDIESDYKENYIDYVVTLSSCKTSTLLFVELARDHIKSPIYSHKDESKIAEAMGAGLLKNISLMKHRGVETLHKLRVYGLLGGATDFDLCKMYAVFPNGNDIDNFYMVFDSSTKQLRFKLLADNECIQTFSSAPNDLEKIFFQLCMDLKIQLEDER